MIPQAIKMRWDNFNLKSHGFQFLRDQILHIMLMVWQAGGLHHFLQKSNQVIAGGIHSIGKKIGIHKFSFFEMIPSIPKNSFAYNRRMSNDLFDHAMHERLKSEAPLAARMRPRSAHIG